MSYKSIFLSILSAILLILAYPKPEIGFLAWFVLVPWFFALQKERPLRAFFLSYLIGLIFFSGTLYWVNYVSGLGFSVLVLYLALYFALFGLLFSINHKQSTINNLFIIPCVWVALEYIRSHLFTGFGWTLLGYSQYRNLAIIQISDFTGAYGVSFLLVLVNVGIWQLGMAILKFRRQPAPAERSGPGKSACPGRAKRAGEDRIFCPLSSVLCPLSAVIIVLSYGYFKLNQPAEGQNIKVAVVQGNIPQEMKWDPDAQDFILERYTQLTKQAALKQPEIIIWPETSVPGFLEDEPQLLKQISSLSKEIFPAYLLVGTPQEGEERRTFNSATLLFRGKIVQRYDKLHLVPFGEYIPLPEVFSRFSFAGLIGNFTPGEDYTVFSLSDKEAEAKLSVLICFEDVFAHLARRFVKEGAEILINITNDAWFKDSSEPYQHLQASVFRAVENRVNLVRSANTGVSCFINPWGKILSKVCDDSGQDVLVQGEKTQNLQIISISSFYTAFGDIFAWLCIVGAVFSLMGRKKP